MSDYHPEKWNPAWGVGTILVGLLSFMNSDESEGTALGMLKTSDACKEKLAEESFDFNRNTDRGHGAIFSELFTIFMWEEEERRQHRMKRRKLEESNEHVKNLIENSENSENGESFSESKISDSSSQGRNFGKIPAEVLRSSRGKRANFFQKWFQPRQTWRCWPFPAEAREAKEALNYAPSSSEKSCSSDENEILSGNSSSSSSNNSPDKSHNTSNSTSNGVVMSGDCENSGEDILKKELDDATAKALSKFDRSRQFARLKGQKISRQEQAKLDHFRKNKNNFETRARNSTNEPSTSTRTRKQNENDVRE